MNPRVGVGALVIRDREILLGKRTHSHGSGTWCPTGGHLEFGETPAECAAREVLEEADLIATQIFPGPWMNDYFEEDQKHYITIFMLITEFSGTPRICEPDKLSEWGWFSFDALPSPLFPSLSKLFESYSLDQLVEAFSAEV